VLAAGTFAQASYSAIWFGVAVMAPALRSQLHLSLGATGVLISASLAGSVVSLIPWGLATDRVGERLVLVVGLGLCAAALLGAAQVTGFAALAALLAAAGLTGASVQSASGRAVMHWFPPSERGVALSIRQTAIPLSGFAVSLGLPAVVRAAGVGWGFAALGLACLAGSAVGGLAVGEAPQPRTDATGGAPAAPLPLRDRRLWTLSVGSALVIAPQLCVAGFAVVFLHEHRGLSAAGAADALAVMQLLAVAGRIGAGRWSDLSGSRIAPLRTIALAASALVVLTGVLVDAPLPALLPMLVIGGVLSMSWNSLSFAAAVELAGHRRSGSAIGIQQTVLNLPGVAYPALFGILVAASSWRVGFLAVALFPLAGWYVLRSLSERRPRDAENRARTIRAGADELGIEEG
jgi:sugar phosphate permease